MKLQSLLKGTVQRDFLPKFFHNSNPPGPFANGIFSILVENSPSYSNLSISTGYDTPACQSPQNIIPPPSQKKNPPKHDSPVSLFFNLNLNNSVKS